MRRSRKSTDIGARLDRIESVLRRLIQSSGAGAAPARRRRGRPPRARVGGRRPGRQPVIIRESTLQLKPRRLQALSKRLSKVADGATLGKDATVFTIADELCRHVLRSDRFTAGDISAAYRQLGRHASVPPVASVDVVQMLRNLAAVSIGKQWVARHPDGTFSLTAKGKKIGASDRIVRRRGRRPGAAAGTRRRGRPPKRRGPGRPKGSKNKPKAGVRRGPGRPPKRRGPGRPKGSKNKPKPGVPRRGPGRPPKMG